MKTGYICGLREFLEHVPAFQRVAIEVPAYPNDVNYFVCDGTEYQARDVARHMLKKYRHGLLVIGVTTSIAKRNHPVLKLICK